MCGRRGQTTLSLAFFETDPVYINLLDIAPFGDVRASMMEWRTEPSDTYGCIDLVSPTPCRPGALDSDDCPVLAYMEHLRGAGWLAVKREVVHTQAIAGPMDVRNCHTKKLYFKSLVKINDLLGSNPEIMSDRPSRITN